MSKYLTVGTVTSLFQTMLGVGVALFPSVFSPGVQSEASTAAAGLIGGVFGIVHLIQHIKAGSK